MQMHRWHDYYRNIVTTELHESETRHAHVPAPLLTTSQGILTEAASYNGRFHVYRINIDRVE